MSLQSKPGAALGLLGLAIVAGFLGGCDGRTEELALARPVLLYEDQPLRVQLGTLQFEAGFVLGSADPDFGGFSGLWISPDGRDLVTVSDHGTIWRATLEHDVDRLVGLMDWRSIRLGPMAADSGSRIDAEALAYDGNGDFVLALEGQEPLHRVTRDDPAAPMRPMLSAGQLSEAGADAGNEGIEALTDLPDGAFLALTEGVFDAPGQLAAWRVGVGQPERLRYAVTEGFVPTGADRLDGAIYVVERRFNLLEGGFVTRLATFDAAQVGAGVSIRGRELGQLAWPALSENFEAVAARRGSDGRVLLYLISDDNFLPIQRTLLLQFSLAP